MKRREFISASCLAAAPLIGASSIGQSTLSAADGRSSAAKQYLELRHYELESEDHQNTFDNFLAQAAIPALGKLGIGPVGVFKRADGQNSDLYVLLPHNSLESVAGANTQMLATPQYQEAGRNVINSPKSSPVYKRLDSALLLAFDDCPRVEVPSKKDTRVFQLRIYESHNTTKAKRKIEMFNKAEIALFRRTGLNPVFFGESIVGGKMPNLTYMVGFDDTDAQKAAWGTFGKHPEWKKMSSDPYYKDTVSNITNIVLRPAPSSQI